MKYGKRSSFKRILASPVATIIALIILVIIARASWNIYQKDRLIGKRLVDAQAEIQKMSARKQDLASKVADLSTPEGIDAEIRSKYHAVKYGESVAVILDDKNSGSANANDSIASSSTLWAKFLHLFGI